MDQAQFLLELPLLLNSSLQIKEVISKALCATRSLIKAEAATVFTMNNSDSELVFWEIEGAAESKLEGKSMPIGQGIVGWVIKEQQSVLVKDAASDPRFFQEVDKQSSFVTRDLICCPLTIKNSRKIGAIQLLNSLSPAGFTQESLDYLNIISHQLAIALDNAFLFEDLLSKKKSLEILDKRKSEMLSVISHELRTPLGIIQGAAEMLGRGVLKDQQAIEKMKNALVKGVDRISALAMQVRDLSVLSEQKDLGLEFAPVQLDILLDSLKLLVAEAFEKRKLTFEIDAPNPAIEISCDATLLLVALKQLIENAVRFTPDGGTVRLKLNSSLGMLHFEVHDNGVGIEAAQIPLVFEKFYEVGDALHHTSGKFEFKSGGLGLGLPLVKAIIEAHGSLVRVTSEPKKGSCFSFSLPI